MELSFSSTTYYVEVQFQQLLSHFSVFRLLNKQGLLGGTSDFRSPLITIQAEPGSNDYSGHPLCSTEQSAILREIFSFPGQMGENKFI